MGGVEGAWGAGASHQNNLWIWHGLCMAGLLPSLINFYLARFMQADSYSLRSITYYSDMVYFMHIRRPRRAANRSLPFSLNAPLPV